MVSATFLTEVVEEAGNLALQLGPRAIRLDKAGNNEFATALSTADIAIQELIIARMRDRYPGIPIIAEENTPYSSQRPERGQNEYFVVDPIDGSYFFLKRSGQYAVQVAFVREGVYATAAAALPAYNISVAAPPWSATGDASSSAERIAFCSPDTDSRSIGRLESLGFTPLLACGLLCMVAPVIWPTSIGLYPGVLSIRGKIGLALALNGGAYIVDKNNRIIMDGTISSYVESILIVNQSETAPLDAKTIFGV